MLRRNEPKQPNEFIWIGTIGDVSFWTFCPFWDISINKKERKIIMLENTMSIQEIFTVQNIVIYFIVINLFGFFIMWLDKRKAKKGAWRIPEKTLFIVTALGGGIGTIAGMYTFRHKTQKVQFVIGFPFITILEIVTILYFIWK